LRWETQTTKTILKPQPKVMGTSNTRPSTPGGVQHLCKGRPRILKAGKERKKSTYRGTKRTLIQQETKEGSIYRKNLKDRKNRKEQEEDRMNRKEQEEDRMNRKEQEYSKTQENHKVKETRTSLNQGQNNNNNVKQTEKMLKPGEPSKNNDGGEQRLTGTNSKNSTKAMNI
jgi:hypothetical protein